LERVRAHAAVEMGIASTVEEASRERLHAPKIAWVARSANSPDGETGRKQATDLYARTLSMGKLHHAMTGTGAVAIAMAAAVPSTVVERVLGGPRREVRIGHASGAMDVGAEATYRSGVWIVTRAVLSRSARRLMDGVLIVPAGDHPGGAA